MEESCSAEKGTVLVICNKIKFVKNICIITAEPSNNGRAL